ncbi:FkbM family methyltransferase [Sneathiella glossodoripedis]|uniref:FkbM family methyltransferase n=1 Tax=Sneathiella glossodoripedis TaxID=418853 RepID=UPI00046F1710|nr:FkbM family methyltransferase [Sneathiella glossodoripedis]
MNIIDNGLFEVLKSLPDQHARSTDFYKFMEAVCLQELSGSNFSSEVAKPESFGPFGDLFMPLHQMGAINSLDLFGLDELVLFSFYLANRNRYKNVVDIGANLGLHSILLARAGFFVTAYEPDNLHCDLLKERIQLNGVQSSVKVVKAAVSNENGESEFVRVEGNTTGSHLAGAKSNPYGELTRYTVKVVAAADVFENVDFAKIDAEGHEVAIIKSIPRNFWENLDVVLEVGTSENANDLFRYFSSVGVNMFSQKLGWRQVKKLEDVPTSYKEGSLFASCKLAMRGKKY